MESLAEPVVKRSAEVKFARFLSYVFHPLLMPTYGFLLLFYTKNYIATFTLPKIKLIVIGITFIFTFLLPLINSLILLKTGRIKSLEMHTLSERKIPYFTTSLYFFALFYLFYNADFPSILNIMVLGAGISIFLTFMISFLWKISAHTVGIGGIAGALLGMIYRLQLDMEGYFLLVLILSGLVGYARLKLHAHTPSQVYCGFVLGFLTELLLMMFYR
ncbi:MAG: phosphatase PAP2 family protein [Bacteroidota bacterium]|nr:phosphatase PAP2 family protein [Bacteroidota bacterium]